MLNSNLSGQLDELSVIEEILSSPKTDDSQKQSTFNSPNPVPTILAVAAFTAILLKEVSKLVENTRQKK